MANEVVVKREVAPATTLDREQIDLIKRTVAVGANDTELKLFLYQANKRGLDPLARQIHFIKRKRYNPETERYEEVGTIQTGIDGFRVVADRTGKLAGISRGALKDDQGHLTGAWAEVYRSDWTHPAREEVSFKEYCQKKKDGSPMGLWATMPETMIKKVAEAAALRMAFPEDLSGIYSHDEMQQADIEPAHQIKQPQTKGKYEEKPQAKTAVADGPEPLQDTAKPEPQPEATESKSSVVEEETSGNLPEEAVEAEGKPGGVDKGKLKRDPNTLKTITDMYKACHADFGLQPKDVMAELNITSWPQLAITPAEAYIQIASVRQSQ